jgi:putative DNA methylase
VGVELGGPRGLVKGARALLAQEKGKVKLRDYRERGSQESLGRPADAAGPAPMIDILQRLLWLAEEDPLHVRDFLRVSGADSERLRLVAQALSGGALTRKGMGTTPGEQSALQSVLASWRRLVEETLQELAR